MSDGYRSALRFLGIESSPAFVREPEATEFRSTSFGRSRSSCCGRYFASVEELRLALLEFKHKYHRQWLVEKHGYRTPA